MTIKYTERITVTDMKAWHASMKDEWLSAWDLLPYGYDRREQRAKRMAKLGMCQRRMNGFVEEYFVSSIPIF